MPSFLSEGYLGIFFVCLFVSWRYQGDFSSKPAPICDHTEGFIRNSVFQLQWWQGSSTAVINETWYWCCGWV